MKQSLKNVSEVDAAADAVINGETALSRREDVSMMASIGKVDGGVTSSDLIIPRLQIAQSVGDLSNKYGFAPGAIVLNKDFKLSNGPDPLSITVLSIAKSYEENLKYDANGPRPRTFRNIDEVVAAGMHCNWVKGQPPPPAREVANALLLVEKPAGMDAARFGVRVDNRDFTLAVWTLRSTAYSRAAKAVFSAAALDLKAGGLLSGVFTLITRKEQLNNNWVFVPDFRLTGRNSADTVAAITAAIRQ